MDNITVSELLIALPALLLIPLIVFGPVLKKAGYARWWALLLVVPFLGPILVWVFAFIKWPAEQSI